MSRVDYGFDQWSVVSFVIKKLCVLIYGETVQTHVLHANIFSPFMIWEYIYRFCRISEFFVDPTRNVNYKEKQNSEKIQRVKIRLSSKTNDVSLTISSKLSYFRFTKSRQKTLETMNVWNLSRNKVDIALANYVMNPLTSNYL